MVSLWARRARLRVGQQRRPRSQHHDWGEGSILTRLRHTRLTPHESANLLLTLERAALTVAEREIGNGEEGGNNTGPHVERYKASVTSIGARIRYPSAWCAAFASHCYVQAIKEINETAQTKLRLPFEPSLGAKALVKNVWKAGGSRLHVPRPGSLIAWHRGRSGTVTWRGHVGVVQSYSADTDTLRAIEGNKNERGRRLAEVGVFVYGHGRWRDRLFGLASAA